MQTFLETFYIKVEESGIAYFRELQNISDNSFDPDTKVSEAVNANLELTPNATSDLYWIHSTSWRYDAPDKITLTYIVYHPNVNFQQQEIIHLAWDELELAKGDDPRIPRPVVIHEKHVVTHAVRHLAFLIQNEPSRFRKMFDGDSFRIFMNKTLHLSGELPLV